MPVDPLRPSEPDDPTSITLQGLSVDVPVGWEARIQYGVAEEEGAIRFPVVHAATVPIPVDRADYGGGVVEQLTSADVFVSLVEFGDEAVGSALFPVVDTVPTITVDMLDPNQLQRRLAGQAGTQVFFTLNGRAFCLYVVIGSYARRIELTQKANEIIGSLSVAAR